MSRNYRHIKQYEREILELRTKGLTQKLSVFKEVHRENEFYI